MSVQLNRVAAPSRPARSTPSRATLRTRPRIQRILIRSWEYIPAVRATLLILRLLAVLVMAVEGVALLSISNWWGLAILAVAFAVLPLSLWVFATAAKGWSASSRARRSKEN
jgi:protein-S-isoprenylcysteine O-methyltransferase Ste14